MKSLKESILSTAKAGKYALIEEWCKNNLYRPFNDQKLENFEIDKNGEIVIHDRDVKLVFDDYTCLPDYIQFADNEKLIIFIEVLDKTKSITSLKGLPNKCGEIAFWGDVKELPSFEITTGKFYVNCGIKKTNKISLDANKIEIDYYGRIDFSQINVKNLKKLVIDECPFYKKQLAKILNGDKTINYTKHRTELKDFCETPITINLSKELPTIFGKSVSSNVEEICFKENETIYKYNGKWYRVRV